MCALVSLTVRREREQNCRGRNLASVTQVVNDSRIIRAVPSVCKKEGISDGLVNSMVTIDDGVNVVYLWCTQDVTAVAALS